MGIIGEKQISWSALWLLQTLWGLYKSTEFPILSHLHRRMCNASKTRMSNELLFVSRDLFWPICEKRVLEVENICVLHSADRGGERVVSRWKVKDKQTEKHEWSSERKTRSVTILGKVERINGRGRLVQLWLPGLPSCCHTIPQAHFWLFFISV